MVQICLLTVNTGDEAAAAGMRFCTRILCSLLVMDRKGCVEIRICNAVVGDGRWSESTAIRQLTKRSTVA